MLESQNSRAQRGLRNLLILEEETEPRDGEGLPGLRVRENREQKPGL